MSDECKMHAHIPMREPPYYLSFILYICLCIFDLIDLISKYVIKYILGS